MAGGYSPVVQRLTVIGVPSSAGSYAAGQDQAPRALRDAGLIEALGRTGAEIRDIGDLPEQVWKPDRDHPRVQNAEAVIECLLNLRDRLQAPLRDGDSVLVLGGNCTIALGVIAALRQLGGRPGLLYFDRQFDLNTPETTTDGALDWMGLAHALGLPGAHPGLVEAFGPPPLLSADQIAWLGVSPELATTWEREQAAELCASVSTSEQLVADPVGAALQALGGLPSGPLAVHLDVDVLDFTDAPLAENTDGRNSGPTLVQLAMGLRAATADPRTRVMSIGEVNPSRSAGDPTALARFVDVIAGVVPYGE